MQAPVFLIPTRRAQAIIADFSVTNAADIPLEEIMVDRRVFPEQALLEGCEARLVLNSKRDAGFATVDSSIPEPGRKRFALAHELGHFELHRSRRGTWMCRGDDFLKWYNTAQEEPEANAFAAELLMPRDLFGSRCVGVKPGFSSVLGLAEVFGTSLTSTAVRYTEVGNYPCGLVASRGGEIRWFRTAPDFPHRIRSVGSRLDALSCAGDHFLNGTSVPSSPERVDPGSWLEDPSSCESGFLYEECVAMPNYGTVLSLIWE